MRFTVSRLATVMILLLLAAPPTNAQHIRRTPRIGFLIGAVAEGAPGPEAFRHGLREFGYIEGQNIVIEWRWAHGDVTRLRDFAEELVRLRVDVIVANSNLPIQAVQKATRTVPVVMVYSIDPIALGFVTSLARPGSNITGLTLEFPELHGKRLQLLKQAVPNLSQVAVLWDPALVAGRRRVKDAEAAAPALGLRLHPVEARSPEEFDSAFAAMTRKGAGAVYYLESTMQFAQRARIAEYAAKTRLPTMCGIREYVEAGCLMGYAAKITDLWRRAAYFVDRILKGATPNDLPVERPTTFEVTVQGCTRPSRKCSGRREPIAYL